MEPRGRKTKKVSANQHSHRRVWIIFIRFSAQRKSADKNVSDTKIFKAANDSLFSPTWFLFDSPVSFYLLEVDSIFLATLHLLQFQAFPDYSFSITLTRVFNNELLVKYFTTSYNLRNFSSYWISRSFQHEWKQKQSADEQRDSAWYVGRNEKSILESPKKNMTQTWNKICGRGVSHTMIVIFSLSKSILIFWWRLE